MNYEWIQRMERLPTHVAVSEMAKFIAELAVRLERLGEIIEQGQKEGRLPPLRPKADA